MSLMLIRLELAPNQDTTQGNANDAYEFTAPLTDEGLIDLDRWDDAERYCTLRRYLTDGTILHGELLRSDRGELVFSYRAGEDDDETIYRFASHVFGPGEYVTITQNDGTDHLYRVASVTRPLVFEA